MTIWWCPLSYSYLSDLGAGIGGLILVIPIPGPSLFLHIDRFKACFSSKPFTRPFFSFKKVVPSSRYSCDRGIQLSSVAKDVFVFLNEVFYRVTEKV